MTDKYQHLKKQLKKNRLANWARVIIVTQTLADYYISGENKEVFNTDLWDKFLSGNQ